MSDRSRWRADLCLPRWGKDMSMGVNDLFFFIYKGGNFIHKAYKENYNKNIFVMI